MIVNKNDFGDDFIWGVSSSAFQTEGAHNVDNKGESIWDNFSNKKGKIFNGQNANIATDFYNRYGEDISLMRSMNISNFRFSLSWSRLIPRGQGHVNRKGVDYYNRLIDELLNKNIEPWVTLYHWDLPQFLEQKGGFTNPYIVNWFLEYVEMCVHNFGDRVKNWIVLNEPMVFTGAGYFLGIHAPGRKGLGNFLPAVHHAALCQAQGGQLIKSIMPTANVGTSFSCSHIEPFSNNKKDIEAATTVDALINRMFIEPLLGMGYPTKELKLLERIEKYIKGDDEKKLCFDFDFIGIQNYTREVVAHSYFTPFLNAKIIKANKRNVPHTLMNWEVYPEAIYHILHKFNKYPNIKKIIVTENGAAFSDKIINGEINDLERISFIQKNIKQILTAKNEGVNVGGYFVWAFTDNFEWAEGYYPRFGLVYVDFKTQQRIIKKSGLWYKWFLET